MDTCTRYYVIADLASGSLLTDLFKADNDCIALRLFKGFKIPQGFTTYDLGLFFVGMLDAHIDPSSSNPFEFGFNYSTYNFICDYASIDKEYAKYSRQPKEVENTPVKKEKVTEEDFVEANRQDDRSI